MEFQDKVVLVTGGTRGIGRQISLDFANEGAIVIANYYHDDNSASSLISDNIDVYKADISSEEEVKKMIDDIISKYKKIDILVNNAGISKDEEIEDKTKDSFMKILEVNLVGAFLVSKYAFKYMENGSIINISSTNGIDTNYIYSLDYDASKAGLISLSANLSKLSSKVRVNTICPGWVDTDMNKDMDLEFKNEELSKIMLNRFGTCKEISNVCLFLASSKASYVNNAIIRVDGGKR